MSKNAGAFPGCCAALLRALLIRVHVSARLGPGSCGAPLKKRCTASGTRDLPLDERLLDHKVAGLAVAAFEEAARRRTGWRSSSSMPGLPHIMMRSVSIMRARLVNIVEQLIRGDQVG